MPNQRGVRSILAVSLAFVVPASFFPTSASCQSSDDSQQILALEHYVTTRSPAPGLDGSPSLLHLRERVQAGAALRGADGQRRVILFVHGAGTPAEVAFDAPAPGYSWMAFLAGAGYDVFSVNMTGYGHSTRPSSMNDPCNLSDAERQALLGPAADRCGAAVGFPATTVESDWADIDAAVEYLRALRHVDRVSLIAWSLGGPRAGGYAARHPEKVDRLILLAPAYRGDSAADPPATFPPGPAMNTQSRADFDANWVRQAPCAAQFEPEVSDAVWKAMLESDPVGATWGTGVRRAPRTPTWGWNREVVAATRIPALIISPATDGQVPPARVHELFADYGGPAKILLDLGCSSHNAHWERNHQLMFDASLEWLNTGSVDGQQSGTVRKGY